jgi:hypothetical protein
MIAFIPPSWPSSYFAEQKKQIMASVCTCRQWRIISQSTHHAVCECLTCRRRDIVPRQALDINPKSDRVVIRDLRCEK